MPKSLRSRKDTSKKAAPVAQKPRNTLVSGLLEISRLFLLRDHSLSVLFTKAEICVKMMFREGEVQPIFCLLFIVFYACRYYSSS